LSTAYPDDVEPYKDFTARLLDFWDALVPPIQRTSSLLPTLSGGSAAQTSPLDGGRILIVSHGGPIKALVGALVESRGYQILGKATSISRIANCSLTEIQITSTSHGWEGKVVKYASVDHFNEEVEAVEGDAEVAGAFKSTPE